MNWLNTENLNLLERYLDLMSKRQALIASNIANVDTPGYHTRDIDFQRELQRAMQGGGEATEPIVHEVTGLITRPDGNNVSVDRESLNLAEAQLKFKTGVALLRQEYQRVMDAIHADK